MRGGQAERERDDEHEQRDEEREFNARETRNPTDRPEHDSPADRRTITERERAQQRPDDGEAGDRLRHDEPVGHPQQGAHGHDPGRDQADGVAHDTPAEQTDQ